MSAYLPRHDPGAAITITATADLTGGTLVTATGATAGADEATVIGVAARDVSNTEAVTVYSGGVQHLIAASTIAIGDYVKSAADGKIAAADVGTDDPTLLIGIALAAGDADADIAVKFLR